jgi:hypothetical protein
MVQRKSIKKNMNKTEQSIKQSQYLNKPSVVWKSFRKIGKFIYLNEKGQMTGDSKIDTIFPNYQMGGTANILRVQSYVRKQFRIRFRKVWYLIPIVTQWESPTPTFGPDVIRDVLKRHQIEGYKALLYYRFAKPMVNENGLRLNTQLLDINQEDEKSRIGIGL